MTWEVTVKRTSRTTTHSGVEQVTVKDGTLQLKFAGGEFMWINHRDWVECYANEEAK